MWEIKKNNTYMYTHVCAQGKHTHIKETKNVNYYMIKQFDFESSEMGGRWFFEVGLAGCTYTLL